MNQHVNAISNRLSLRKPQRRSLEILSEICDLIPLDKDSDLDAQLAAIRDSFDTVEDFERDFPSFCFALATGVGKTRLMGAFIAYLHRAEKVQHFFVLAPNLTIYRKLIADFTPGTPKYVFQGISEFATRLPQVITSDNYESGIGVRKDGHDARGQQMMFDDSPIHINIFNISKINSEARGGKEPLIKRLNEYIGDSYFDYLAGLDDLVLLMDESHRYRASAGIKAINELRPILGLELTATPQVERGKTSIPFKNAIYSYPLASALTDGYIKQPAVATRSNFTTEGKSNEDLETIKLKDGILVHQETMTQLQIYATENNVRRVKPFMLVVARDIEHASELEKRIEDKEFFDGAYKGKVITVHSKTKSEESDDIVEKLLSVEDPSNPVEIVIHVNMLKEGWDVTNLYTIVPLRKADSRTLVEQSIGRGLRLPYGKRTGVPEVDRLTIVAHDKFQEIVDEANRGDSILITGVIIGEDIPDKKSKVIEVKPNIFDRLIGGDALDSQETDGHGLDGQSSPKTKPLFTDEVEVDIATKTLDIIQNEFDRLPRSKDLTTPEITQQIVMRVKESLRTDQLSLEGMDEGPTDETIEKTVAKVADAYTVMTIDIPRITVVPSGKVTTGYHDFDLNTVAVTQQPVDDQILIQTLRENKQYRLARLQTKSEDRLEDYIVRGLLDCPEIDYDTTRDLLYKLTGQLIAKLRSYLPDDEAVANVLQVNHRTYVELVRSQMKVQFYQDAEEYEVNVTRGVMKLRPAALQYSEDETIRPFRQPVDEKKNIRRMVFGGFKKCLFDVQKFDSDSERRFAVVLENDTEVIKWVKPIKTAFQIEYENGQLYEPDFVAETKTAYYICEPKAADEMDDVVVQKKTTAAINYCQSASKVAGKPWHYLLIPHNAINDSQSLSGLAAQYTLTTKSASGTSQ